MACVESGIKGIIKTLNNEGPNTDLCGAPTFYFP